MFLYTKTNKSEITDKQWLFVHVLHLQEIIKTGAQTQAEGRSGLSAAVIGADHGLKRGS